ncbi:hypothetical protein SAMN05216600_101280 [Pseudomonas cuatrocienegasensis]|uniref:DUF2946 domain-containing protein n=1 Tax=Pseudomonas cuatrocienegasensis TaxID=543360 RepID=A0ABY1B136_9PSED|nr:MULTISPECIES: hypothetical protein [Pseudomonas]OEC36552.1 hypothetical protein A7D25_05205 [Pseudomonas sp. 21C1]SEP67556.1 hypothetical protein SAMN05216600_101280 [Pseudomonas cuatrocienegasensis]
MRKTLRTALIWILMLALPAQAMAALGMQVCGAARQAGGMPEMAMSHGGHHVARSITEAPAPVAAHAQHQPSKVDTAQQPAGDSRLCSLCAFCVGAVTLNSLSGCQAPQHSDEPSLTRLEQFVGFISEPLERPPRLTLV